jgi:L-alanine-DL-glutamate epimerase-like enolase superfamily enzyme
MRAVRKAFGEDLVILTDANIGYQLEDVRQVMPALDEIRAGWLEEPFPAHDYRSYKEAKLLGRTPLAAGENHYTRFEFNRVIEDGAITILQPDLSKCGGITEALRIAALASDLEAADPSAQLDDRPEPRRLDPFPRRDRQRRLFRRRRIEIESLPRRTGGESRESRPDGNVYPLDRPGIGLEVDEAFLAKHPAIEGPGYV